VLLIYPPVAKPSEPPAGIAVLAGALSAHGVNHTVLDANIEGLLFLAGSCSGGTEKTADKWSARALRNINRNLAMMKSRDLYLSLDRYKRAVADINKVIGMSAEQSGVLGLANYQHRKYSPLRSSDLVMTAENPEQDPFFPYFKARLTSLIELEQPALIGVSVNYLSQALTAFAMAGFLKKRWPHIRLVFGGGLITSWMKVSGLGHLFDGLIDHLVTGPGEGPLLEILGIKTGENKNAAKEKYAPEYSSFPLNDYLSPGLVLPYSSSSGCHWNKCSFCPEKAEKNRFIPVAEKQVMHDIASLVAKHDPVLIHLLDNSVRPSVLKLFAKHPPGAPWYGFTRITADLADPAFCASLRESGCVMFKLGLESGDQSLLDKLGKGIDLYTASMVLKALKKAGIAAYVYLLFGTPEETPEAAGRTLDYVARHSGEIGFLNLAVFNMPRACGEEDISKRDFYEGDLSLYTDFSHPHGWDRKSVRHFLDTKFRKNRAIAGILKKDPPIFTSNHAPFFHLFTR